MPVMKTRQTFPDRKGWLRSPSAAAAPIVVQSMTNTDTADIDGTVAQVKALARAGSELVRVTVNNDESAAAVPHIRERLDAQGSARRWWAIFISMAISC